MNAIIRYHRRIFLGLFAGLLFLSGFRHHHHDVDLPSTARSQADWHRGEDVLLTHTKSTDASSSSTTSTVPAILTAGATPALNPSALDAPKQGVAPGLSESASATAANGTVGASHSPPLNQVPVLNDRLANQSTTQNTDQGPASRHRGQVPGGAAHSPSGHHHGRSSAKHDSRSHVQAHALGEASQLDHARASVSMAAASLLGLSLLSSKSTFLPLSPILPPGSTASPPHCRPPAESAATDGEGDEAEPVDTRENDGTVPETDSQRPRATQRRDTGRGHDSRQTHGRHKRPADPGVSFEGGGGMASILQQLVGRNSSQVAANQTAVGTDSADDSASLESRHAGGGDGSASVESRHAGGGESATGGPDGAAVPAADAVPELLSRRHASGTHGTHRCPTNSRRCREQLKEGGAAAAVKVPEPKPMSIPVDLSAMHQTSETLKNFKSLPTIAELQERSRAIVNQARAWD
ncbi:hypothetical protein CYMTET_26934 [Cymbomonas tetramitiformis]|uniref:Uncharacterized protein n=1 Tax=Cymbomonas tetramitiformis TaxID=36881 RepID=A0AAE0KXR2_9CHLO|nr:hypothetical protein CYMTET_26934 [Cymbomonas tetramitiformis]